MGCEKKMEKIIEKKIVAVLVLLLLVASSIVSFTGNIPTVYTVQADGNEVKNPEEGWKTSSDNNSAWHNTSYLNVTIESKYPKILWYDIQVYTGGVEKIKDMPTPPAGEDTVHNNWTSIRNNMTIVDNATWLRFVINISSDQGWGNIEYINITGWHDNWDSALEVGDGYNASGNHGSNRNFFLSYENTNDSRNHNHYEEDAEDYSILWPRNATELTIGNFTSENVTDELGIDTSHTRNLTFQFKPGYQFRYAPGRDGTGDTWTNYSVENRNGLPYSNKTGVVDYAKYTWEQIENLGSWNFNITVQNRGYRNNGSNFPGGPFRSWVLDEFGVYSYTEIVSAQNVHLQGAPGETASTNSSDPYNDETSKNVTIKTISNGNYSLVVNISDLYHSAYESNIDVEVQPHLILSNETIFIRGGNLTERQNFSANNQSHFIALYGDIHRENGTITRYEQHEVNGTYKLAGENGTDGLHNNYPNDYNVTGNGDDRAFNGLNNRSYYIEFSCVIPIAQWPGKYSTNVYYHLRTETH